jgi:pyruvate dehydrogenase E1 component beta subunit
MSAPVNFVGHVNALVRTAVAGTERIVCYGQNIAAGSCLSGLTRGLAPGAGGLVLNTPNAENSLVAMGFGMLMRDVSSIFFMKQQDFLLLGMDHLVNTYNIVRRRAPAASYTIVAIIVDQGFEGPQSCLNNLSDFCSMANVPGYVVSNHADADIIVPRHLVSPGFRILGVSQRLFGNLPAPLAEPATACEPDGGLIRYTSGAGATVVAFNTAFPQALAVHQAMEASGRKASLFSVNAAWRCDWSEAIADIRRTGRLVVLDDSKSANRTSDRFLLDVHGAAAETTIVTVRRSFSENWLRPNPDVLEVDPADVMIKLWPQAQSKQIAFSQD